MLGAMLLSVSPALAQTRPPSHNGKIETPGCGPRVWVEYTDDDPDYFIIKNRSPKGWNLVMLAIDLAASPFYPDAISPVRLVGTLPAQDGGRTIGLQFEGFRQDRDYTFHVDLDAIPSSGGRTWVLPGDMKGARILATFKGPTGQSDKVDAFFDNRAEADSGAGSCV